MKMKWTALAILISLAFASQASAVLRPLFPIKPAAPSNVELIVAGEDFVLRSAISSGMDTARIHSPRATFRRHGRGRVVTIARTPSFNAAGPVSTRRTSWRPSPPSSEARVNPRACTAHDLLEAVQYVNEGPAVDRALHAAGRTEIGDRFRETMLQALRVQFVFSVVSFILDIAWQQVY